MKKNNLEKAYNPRKSVNNYKYFLNNSIKKSKKISVKLCRKVNISYGKGPLQKLDVYFIKDRKKLNPIHIFIHGGYWRSLDKKYHSHMAKPFLENNVIFFNINYDLLPKVNLSRIRDEIIEAIVWIYRNSIKFNGNNRNIVISGHSAGAHLVSLMLGIDWTKYNLPHYAFKGAALISGIYDVEIVCKLDLNEEIKLSREEAKQNTTINKFPIVKFPLLFACGKKEPIEWRQQTIIYHNLLKKFNFNVKLLSNLNENHFSLIDAMAKNKNILFQSMLKLTK